MRIKKSVATFLRWQRVCRVATRSRAGTPHVVPVCHVFDGDTLYFGSDGTARKIKHLRDNSQIAVTVDLYSDEWSVLRGVMLQGTAELIERGPRFRKIQRLLYEKFPQYPEQAALGKGAVIVAVTPRHVFTWGLDN